MQKIRIMCVFILSMMVFSSILTGCSKSDEKKDSASTTATKKDKKGDD